MMQSIVDRRAGTVAIGERVFQLTRRAAPPDRVVFLVTARGLSGAPVRLGELARASGGEGGVSSVFLRGALPVLLEIAEAWFREEETKVRCS
jgi:hypothetical protein